MNETEKARMNEKAKEFLRGYSNAQKRIQNIEYKITELYAAQTGSAIKYSDMPKGHNISDLSDYMAKRDSLEREWQEEKIEALRKLEKISTTISLLTDEQEQQVLILRYIKHYKWETIMELMYVSWMTMHRIHSRALSEIYMLIQNDIE